VTPSEELTSSLRDLTRVVKHGRRQWALRRPGLPQGALDLLFVIAEMDRTRPACHAKELVDRTGLDASTISRAIGVLVDAGLVERHPDPRDRRASLLAVTADGRAVLSDADRWYDDVLLRALADWRPEDISTFARQIDRLSAGLGEAFDTRTLNRDLEAAR
jgi:DNA-binding MarR family transcriptional regulator